MFAVEANAPTSTLPTLRHICTTIDGNTSGEKVWSHDQLTRNMCGSWCYHRLLRGSDAVSRTSETTEEMLKSVTMEPP